MLSNTISLTVKPKISYMDALLKNNKLKNNELKKPTNDIFKVKQKKKSIQECPLCKNKYIFTNNLKTVYHKITKQQTPKKIKSSWHKFNKTKHKELICKQCAHNLIFCYICDKKFYHCSTTFGYNKPELKKLVNVCIKCYFLEACDYCGYLGGASPCRWFRSFM